MFQTYRARHRAAGAVLGLSGLLPLATPGAASAASAPSVVAAAQAAPAASAASTASAPRVAALPFAPHPQTHDVVIHNPYLSKDHLAPGWTVANGAGPSMKVVCNGPSVAGRVANTYSCLPAASFAVACFAKPGYTDRVTCVIDPRRKRLVEYRTNAPLRPTAMPAIAIRRPLAAVMDGGQYCRLTSSGVAVRKHESVVSWAACEDAAGTRLWQNPDGSEQYRVTPSSVQYRAATEQTGSPVTWTTVSVRYWIG